MKYIQKFEKYSIPSPVDTIDDQINAILELVSDYEISPQYLSPGYKFGQNPVFTDKLLYSNLLLKTKCKQSTIQNLFDIAGVILDKKPVAWINNYGNSDLLNAFIEYAEKNGVVFKSTINWTLNDTSSIICAKGEKNAEYAARMIDSYIKTYTEDKNIKMFHARMGILLGYPKESIKEFINR